MKNFNKDIGDLGEELSIKYLENNNYKILDKNFRCKNGEIDIIAIKNSIISFVEVKSRFFTSFGKPRESITYSKQLKIINSAKYYVFKNDFYNYNIRFDVIEIIFDLNSTNYTLNYIKDAFRLN
ncbi:MAG: YraN family protein [Clostridium perfringens]|nr:YraN family protein [Clostridium perfringens]